MSCQHHLRAWYDGHARMTLKVVVDLRRTKPLSIPEETSEAHSSVYLSHAALAAILNCCVRNNLWESVKHLIGWFMLSFTGR